MPPDQITAKLHDIGSNQTVISLFYHFRGCQRNMSDTRHFCTSAAVSGQFGT